MRACVWTVRDLPTTSSSLFRVPRPRHRTTMRAAATRRQTALLAKNIIFLCFYQTRCLSLSSCARLRREPGLNLPAPVPVQVRALRSVPPARWTRRGRRRRRRRAPAARLPDDAHEALAVTKLSGVRVRRLFPAVVVVVVVHHLETHAHARRLPFFCLGLASPSSSRSRRLLGTVRAGSDRRFVRARAHRARASRGAGYRKSPSPRRERNRASGLPGSRRRRKPRNCPRRARRRRGRARGCGARQRAGGATPRGASPGASPPSRQTLRLPLADARRRCSRRRSAGRETTRARRPRAPAAASTAAAAAAERRARASRWRCSSRLRVSRS